MDKPDEKFEVSTVGKLREKYYGSSERAHIATINPANVPEKLKSLIPFAQRWGINDDILRADAIKQADADEMKRLKQIVAENDDLLDEWLAGPDSKSQKPTAEYIAFTAMRMAADGC